jgi:hypothetical protein
MPSDATCVGKNTVVVEFQYGSWMCTTIQLTDISMFIISSIIIINYSQHFSIGTELQRRMPHL